MGTDHERIGLVQLEAVPQHQKSDQENPWDYWLVALAELAELQINSAAAQHPQVVEHGPRLRAAVEPVDLSPIQFDGYDINVKRWTP